MGHEVRMRFAEETICHGQPQDALQPVLVYLGRGGDLTVRNGSVQRDGGRDVEMIEPLEAGRVVVLFYPISNLLLSFLSKKKRV